MKLLISILIFFSCTQLLASEEWLVEKHKLTPKNQKVDILFIIDSAPSLSDKRQQLANAIPTLLDSLDGVDWQIAITNTDGSMNGLNGGLLKLNDSGLNKVDLNTPKKERMIQGGIVHPINTSTSHRELKQPLAVTLQTLEHFKESNHPFLRNDSHLLLIYLTDEDELKTGPWYSAKPSQITHAMQTYFPSKFFLAFNFIIPGEKNCRLDSNPDAVHSTHLHRLIKIHYGASFDLCNSEFESDFVAMTDFLNKFLYSANLSESPLKNSVTVSDNPQLEDFITFKNKLFFPYYEAQEEINFEVKYQKTDDVVEPR